MTGNTKKNLMLLFFTLLLFFSLENKNLVFGYPPIPAANITRPEEFPMDSAKVRVFLFKPSNFTSQIDLYGIGKRRKILKKKF